MDIMSTLINALIGITVVFAVLILLMLIISIMSKIMKSGKGKPAAEKVAPAAAAEVAAPKAARGSCGELKLFDVPDKTAAQLMAITADKLGVPLNTLRFISIKEVK